MRDLRDPQLLGEFLITQRDQLNNSRDVTGGSPPLSELYDFLFSNYTEAIIPDYPQDESLARVSIEEYRAELEARAAHGDKYAASAIESLDRGKRVEGYDPSGN